MLDKGDNLVIFEYTTFTKRLRDWSRSLPPDWSDVIEKCLSKHKAEQNLEKLVEGVWQESHRYDNAFDTWMESSLNLAEYRQETDSLIHRLSGAQPLDDNHSMVPSMVIIGLMRRLATELQAKQLFTNSLGRDILSRIEEYEERGDQNSDSYPPILQKMDVEIENLQKIFHEELDFIPKNSETDDIFRGVEEIGNDILFNIKRELAELGPITDDTLDSALANSEEIINKFVYESQRKINEQIRAAFEKFKRIFDDKLIPDIKIEIQKISVPLLLGYHDPEILHDIVNHIKGLNQDIKDLESRLEKFPDDLKQSCESFREDFKCLNTLDEYKQNEEFEDKEVETLQHLFGTNGTSVSARLHINSKDFEVMAKRAYEIDRTYDWSVKSKNQNIDELEKIFEHAVKRLAHIENYIEGKLNG